MELISLFPCYHQKPTAILLSIPITKRRLANRNSNALKCRSALSSSHDDSTKPSSPSLHREGRRELIASLLSTAEAASTSRRALRASKIPESDFTTLSNGLKYYDLKVGGGPKALKGSRVAVHYVAKWKGITFMTSRQGLGVGGGTPYGFDVGQSERGAVLKGLDLGVEGMRVGGQRLLIVPPALAYGSKGVQEIPPNATIE
ncbi:FKBP-TYPE PEPTIDYL-PROLYL CIS-TRANS ISOMERASE FKPA [Salix purpurea]|uniref:peptidylprolyl isomerase n=1 Tax=Salix purpurea TaxID=77065 RepID=A0A9Q0VYA3_SALPP|nr:FKBP-TYPE PEPTIDYL-PROLYL CIS-TRANS ISOMERASE FKPA [Salix purpurea]